MNIHEWFTVSDEGPTAIPTINQDRRRHRQRLEAAIRENLADMVVNEQVSGSDPAAVLTVGLDELQEYRLRYDPSQGPWASLGQVEPDGSESSAETEAEVRAGGSEEGEETRDTTIVLEECTRAIFAPMQLPNMDPTRTAPGRELEYELLDVGRYGRRWAKRRSLAANITRRALQGAIGLGPFRLEDMRYWQWQPKPEEGGGAVVMALMDTSGSMGSFEKYLAKSFFYWTVQFLRIHYPTVEVVFIAHDVRAREVDEDTFFHRGASGGTVSSSAYRLALEVLHERYPVEDYNAYAFHFSDGGNLTSDNPVAVEVGAQLGERVNLFGYGEIHDTERTPSQLLQGFQARDMKVVLLRSKSDVLTALGAFFGDEGAQDLAHRSNKA